MSLSGDQRIFGHRNLDSIFRVIVVHEDEYYFSNSQKPG